MKLLLLCFLLTLGSLRAADDSKTFPGRMYSPDVVLHFGKQLDLSEEQTKFLRRELEEAKVAAKEHQDALAREAPKLGRLMRKSVTGEKEAAEQMRRVIDHEVELKLIQWRMIVRAKNQLSSEQREKLARLAKNFDRSKMGPSQAQRKRLEDKMAKVKKGMRELADLGVSPEEIGNLLQGLDPLFQEQKYDAAEALIDKALKKLDDPF